MLPLTDFYVDVKRSDGRHSYCKPCHRARNRRYDGKYLKNNPETHKARRDRWAKENPDRVRESSRRTRLKRYGLTPEAYDDMVEAQDGACAICRRPTEALRVDHDHDCCPADSRSCGRCVRQLLCDSCNRALGMFQDSPKVLRDAASYIERHRRSA